MLRQRLGDDIKTMVACVREEEGEREEETARVRTLSSLKEVGNNSLFLNLQ
jgi:hypothetical protein